MTKVYHKKTGKNDHGTPQALFDYYDGIYGFELDAAASSHNSKCKKYITEKENSLTLEWITKVKRGSAVWLNPPYSHVKEFIRRAYQQSKKYDLTVACLVPARTGSIWFKSSLERGGIRFINSRVCFDGQSAGAGFPSIVVVFGKGKFISFDVLTPKQRGFNGRKNAKRNRRRS